MSWGALLTVAAAMLTIASIDNRNSPQEHRGRGWIRPKELAKWRDSLLSYQRVTPPHVQRMRKYEMGQITQAWHVLEASDQPVADSWYLGRDIGAVGYFTGVRVFDTAGLVTIAVTQSRPWVEKRRVTDELVRAAMAHQPLAGEVYEDWPRALGGDPAVLRGYRLRRGSADAPVAFLAIDRKAPARGQVLQRYRQFAAKFPQAYHLHTLYGEAVGAVVERRLRIVSEGL